MTTNQSTKENKMYDFESTQEHNHQDYEKSVAATPISKGYNCTVYYLVSSCNRYLSISPLQAEEWGNNRSEFMKKYPVIASKFKSACRIKFNLSSINCSIRVDTLAISI
jgi:hypothetical protein